MESEPSDKASRLSRWLFKDEATDEEVREIHCRIEDAGKTLRDHLTDTMVDLSTSALRRLLKEGRVLSKATAVDGGLVLQGTETFTIRLPADELLLRLTPNKLKGFEVLYEDEAVLACAKPSGVGVTPDRGELAARFLGACLRHLQSSEGATTRPRVVHRLDKETSGVVLVAKSREALRSLTDQFHDNVVEKTYAALVFGVPHKDEGDIDLPIGFESQGNKLRAGGKDAREARTHFKLEQSFRGYSLLEVKPITGRQHQIRIHLEAVGHPLVVDGLYGNAKELKLSSFKKSYVPNRRREERPLLDRTSLHSRRIKFKSPATEQLVTVEAPFPKDLRVTLDQLSKWARPRSR